MSLRKSSLRKARHHSGFTLIETMVAIFVLTVGLMSTAALMSSSVRTTARSHYVSQAAMLASEKLEDLGRFNQKDAAMNAGGTLGADTAGYFDNIQISSVNGGIAESTNTGGVSTVYTQQPGAGVTVTQGAGLAAPSPDSITYNRRWIITQDTPVPNVRTITVLVTLTDGAMNPPISFQMSMVHP